MMKIAFLNINQDAVNRGAETFVREVSKRLSEKHKVKVFGFGKAPVSRWPVVWRAYIDPHGFYTFWYTLMLIPVLWKEKFDVILPLNGGWQPAIIRILTWLYGGKMIISGQSGKGWDDRNNLWSFPDCFVALSGPLQKWAKKANPFVRVTYIPNGVDDKKFRPIGSRIKFDLEKPVILCVGALTKDKRIELAIKAASLLRKGSLLVVGEGKLKQNLARLARRLLGRKFLIKSFDYKDMPKVYRAADLFTLPSPWYRSFEIVLVEAMATNLPVVANNDPIRREIVGDAGILVDPTDTASYAKALGKVLNTDWGEKPRKQAEKFSWDKIVKQYEKLFHKLMN